MNLEFIKGKATVKQGRKTVAKIYYRPDFLKGLKVNYSKDWSVELITIGVSKELDTLKECEEAILKHCTPQQLSF